MGVPIGIARGYILYRFWDKVWYWPEIAIFLYRTCIRCPC